MGIIIIFFFASFLHLSFSDHITSTSNRHPVMRCFTPRLSAAGNGVWRGFRQMYEEYALWRDRRDDERYTAVSEEGEEGITLSNRRICANPNACPRSVLLVPAECIVEALRRERRGGVTADAVMFDLTCCRGSRGEARDNILRFLQAEEKGEKRGEDMSGGQCSHDDDRGRYLIRVNSPEFDSANGFLDMELAAVLGERIEGVLLPAVTVNTYSLVEEYIHPSHHLWAFFDTPLSVVQASEICRQGHYRYAVMGSRRLAEDLHLPIGGITYGDTYRGDNNSENATPAALLGSLPLLNSSLQVLLAARAFNMNILDDAFEDASDTAGFSRDLHLSRSLGFEGKLVINPAQLASCHAAFAPSAEELSWARGVQQRMARRYAKEESAGKLEAAQWRRAACLLERHREEELQGAAPTQRDGGGGVE
ncbi:hypothetical protein, conserved [Trypanosoma cruzi]|uniref:HpcH/HpaI aldolase/citrate lyase domain-containing protein n=2 Tax=Trypanosoma cruzi TaxID=5693 RepID=Q4DJF6_TRYCC|nr:hypothetical protein, conserved [Trypanosoma cruzi]EAN92648.1 hypothetical protein, conserved [Trypanosoma cruzi]|eukprot:XP_814499.1 hypothetical protein [Trypanosoma cruzi strain CL Brener]